ncbi:MAG: hypothetical protein WC867_06775 [Candidatus Pacearchaeota archaeon]|jgi:hypothetical protein
MNKIKADLHNHLRTSSRNYQNDFNKTIDITSSRLGPGGVIGLINFSDKRYESFIDLNGYERVFIGENKNGIYIPEKNVLVIKGQEVPTKLGHVLVLGLEKDVYIKENRSLIDTINESLDNGGIVVSDHPYYAHGIGNYLESNPKILENIDAIEVHNGEAALGIPKTPLPYGSNKKAQLFYDRIKPDFPHLGALSSSDGHSLYELGRSWTEIDNLNLENKTKFTSSLRNSIRNTNNLSERCNKNSIIGAIDHITDLIIYNI